MSGPPQPEVAVLEDHIPTIRDVARETCVSLGTASKALWIY
jgi:hypothetical protein